LFFHVFHEITVFAEFSDDICIVGGLKYINESDYILTVEFLHDFNLRADQPPGVFVFDLMQIDDFNCYDFLCAAVFP